MWGLRRQSIFGPSKVVPAAGVAQVRLCHRMKVFKSQRSVSSFLRFHLELKCMNWSFKCSNI